MHADKRKKLEAAGFTVGDTREFLGLSEAEFEVIDLRIRLSKLLRQMRVSKNWTQTYVAQRICTDQPRVAKMEAGDPSVSLDALFKSLVVLGASREELSKVVAA